MATYTILPTGQRYWIMLISPDKAPLPIESFTDEDAAVRRLRALQKGRPSTEQQALITPPKASS
jgi:hypothetical protein